MMTSNLSALLAIVERLMQKNGTYFTWSQDAQGFKAALAESTSARFLDDLLRVSAISRHRHSNVC
jgi:hypothetical protein